MVSRGKWGKKKTFDGINEAKIIFSSVASALRAGGKSKKNVLAKQMVSKNKAQDMIMEVNQSESNWHLLQEYLSR